MAGFSHSGFPWPPKDAPSSRVIKNPAQWQDAGILVPHECFRWYDKHILQILDKLNHEDQWRTALFAKWVQRYYLDAIHHHHGSEEKIYNPGIEKAGGQLPAKITSDHSELLRYINDITTSCKTLEQGPNKEVLEKMKSTFKEFIHKMEDHLAEEEDVYPRVLRECGMKEHEEGQMVETIIQSLGLDGNKVMLPPILYVMCIWRGEDEMQKFGMNIPGPIRALTQNCWLDDFKKNNLDVISGLLGPDFFTPETPSCGCSIQ